MKLLRNANWTTICAWNCAKIHGKTLVNLLTPIMLSFYSSLRKPRCCTGPVQCSSLSHAEHRWTRIRNHQEEVLCACNRSASEKTGRRIQNYCLLLHPSQSLCSIWRHRRWLGWRRRWWWPSGWSRSRSPRRTFWTTWGKTKPAPSVLSNLIFLPYNFFMLKLLNLNHSLSK